MSRTLQGNARVAAGGPCQKPRGDPIAPIAAIAQGTQFAEGLLGRTVDALDARQEIRKVDEPLAVATTAEEREDDNAVDIVHRRVSLLMKKSQKSRRRTKGYALEK